MCVCGEVKCAAYAQYDMVGRLFEYERVISIVVCV